MEEHAFERQGQVAVHVESTAFSVAPGGSVTVPLLLHNQGAADEFFELSVRGIPSNWMSVRDAHRPGYTHCGTARAHRGAADRGATRGAHRAPAGGASGSRAPAGRARRRRPALCAPRLWPRPGTTADDRQEESAAGGCLRKGEKHAIS
jgi:hypothetical protein